MLKRNRLEPLELQEDAVDQTYEILMRIKEKKPVPTYVIYLPSNIALIYPGLTRKRCPQVAVLSWEGKRCVNLSLSSTKFRILRIDMLLSIPPSQRLQMKRRKSLLDNPNEDVEGRIAHKTVSMC
jgi:hypothetical protein